jgi:hypothetical protein
MSDPAVPAPEDFSADQFRLLADNVPALIACYDAATRRCLFANKQYARTFGCDERSIVGRTFAEVIGETAAREIAPRVDHVLEQREAVMYGANCATAASRAGSKSPAAHLAPDGAAIVLRADQRHHQAPARAAVRESENAWPIHAGEHQGVVRTVASPCQSADPR